MNGRKKRFMVIGTALIIALWSISLIGGWAGKASDALSNGDDDTTPPKTELWYSKSTERGENGWFTSRVIYSLVASDETEDDPTDYESGVKKTLINRYGRGWEEFEAETAYDAYYEGYYNVKYYSIDNAGNEEDVNNYTIKIDKFSPAVELVYPSEGDILNGTVTVKWAANDTMDTNLTVNFWYKKADGTDWLPLAWDEENDGTYMWDISSWSEATYHFKIEVVDDAGNTGEETVSVTIDHPLPTVEITRPKDSGLYLRDRELITFPEDLIIIGSITMEVEAYSEVAPHKVEFYLDDTLLGSDDQEPYTYSVNNKTKGSHILKVKFFDDFGREASDEIEAKIFNF